MLPIEVSDLDMAFPAKVDHLLPNEKEIPEQIEQKWLDFESVWFYKGFEPIRVVPKEGIDLTKALRHLACIQGTYSISHQRKQRAVAWLASQWLEDVQWSNE